MDDTETPEQDLDAPLPGESLTEWARRKDAEEGIGPNGPVNESRRTDKWDRLSAYDPNMGNL